MNPAARLPSNGEFSGSAPRPGASEKIIDVAIGAMRVSQNPAAVIAAYGVGSCVAVCMYDPGVPLGGMAHVFLPTAGKNDTGHDAGGRYADKAVPLLMRRMLRRGASKDRLVCKIAGGAHIVAAQSSEGKNIGAQNLEVVNRTLEELDLPPVAQDVAGEHSRTVKLFVKTGALEVSSTRHGVMKL